jgi:hypothetical protein
MRHRLKYCWWALAVAAAGCAHQPPAAAALSGQLNVMQAARELGYTTPRVVKGQTLYCQAEEVLGSVVPKMACLDADQIMAQARQQGELIQSLRQREDSVSMPQGPGH